MWADRKKLMDHWKKQCHHPSLLASLAFFLMDSARQPISHQFQTIWTIYDLGLKEIVMNELRRFKHSADFLANSSHIIESAAISAS
jgi:hypothetical protein